MSNTANISYHQWLAQSVTSLEKTSSSATIDARVLLCYCLQQPLSYLLTWPEKLLTSTDRLKVDELLKRRILGTPIAYLIGSREFWSMTFKITPDVLIPRPETELMVEWAIQCISERKASSKGLSEQGFQLLELGTGSGIISIALAKEIPDINIVATDISEKSLVLAAENATLNGCSNIRFVQGNWFDCINSLVVSIESKQSVDLKKFDIILSNPPYIAPDDPHLAVGDLQYEPQQALVASSNGLADIQCLIFNAKDYLMSGGWLAIEHGYDQADEVSQLMQLEGYQQLTTIKDLAGNDRLTVCRWDTDE